MFDLSPKLEQALQLHIQRVYVETYALHVRWRQHHRDMTNYRYIHVSELYDVLAHGPAGFYILLPEESSCTSELQSVTI